MFNRWSLLVLVVGALAGYTLGGPSVQAQTEPVPFTVGDTVTLWFREGASQPSFGSSVDCTVAEILGGYVRCGPRTRVGGGSDREERWFALKYVLQITRRER